MAIIQFDNGQKVKFDGNPTSQDVDEVAASLGIGAKPIDNKVSFLQKAANPMTYINSQIQGQKQVGELTGILPAVREIARPFWSTYQSAKSLFTGKPEESLKIPFVGEVKTYSQQGALDRVISGIDVLSALPFVKAARVGVAATTPALKAAAEKLYESLLKPLKSDVRRVVGYNSLQEKAASVVKTGLEQGIKITRKGQAKLTSMIDTLDTEVDSLIEEGKAAGSKIDLYKLVDYTKNLRDHYGKAFGGEELVKKLDDFTINFIKPKWDKFGQYMPIEEAQATKQATYRLIKTFGDALSGKVEDEVKKQLARGVKDDIAKQVPEIDLLNQAEKKLLDLQPALDRAIQRLSKKDIIGLSDLGVVGAEILSTKGKLLGIPSLMWKVVTSPAVKSTIAIRMNQLSKLKTDGWSYAGKRALSGLLNYFKDFVE